LVITIFQDSNRNIWVATLEGLNLLRAENAEDGIFEQFLHVPEDSSTIAGNSIRQIFEDGNGNIWIATEGGLSRYIAETQTFENYYHSDGLPVDEIRSIIEDDNGILWIGTIKGLSRFNPDNNSFTNFDKSDGLQSNEFSRYSVHKTPDGELLFGGLSGFNLFHPDDIENNPHIPPVYLTDFKLFNRSVVPGDPNSPLENHISVTDTLTLSYDQDVITFDFIALNYTRPEYNQYAYMVEGFEEDWNYVGTQRNATYTNLDPGEYTFRVKASNNDGVWNEEGASLHLIITPPFWQTTWFYLLATLFIIGSVISVYRYRVRSIQERNRQLEQQVAERTEELREKNNDLESTLKELEETKDELVEKAHKAGMADIATGVLHNVGNVLTSVNTSASLIEDTVRQSKLKGLIQANNLLREKIDHIEEFITNDPKGKNLLEYYLKLEGPLQKEQEKMTTQAQRLINKIELIKEIIAAQQSYAGTGMNAESVSLTEVIENALSLQAGSIERHGLHIEKDFQSTEKVFAQRSKLIHVLVNILKNAKEAMNGMDPNDKQIVIKTWQDDENVFISISDTGSGIKEEHKSKIFTQGFTTKKNGHGFGLHSSANYMSEMGGNIKMNSNGDARGAEFILSLPLNSKTEAAEN
ncbi:MAG: triple tyrosine motif-containing protein, partial [Balneolaceae bacterium]|nr:triple tyrosine motif-containing protein [Balneolaceae bacterium]